MSSLHLSSWLTVIATIFIACGVSSSSATAVANNSSPLCQALCESPLKDKTVFPGDDGTYTGAANSYFSNQEQDLTPGCIVQAEDSGDVSTFVKLVVSLRNGDDKDVQFAVRSGGHTPFPTSANIDGPGATLDLRKLNHITVAPDRKSITTGPGNTWGDLYELLDEMRLGVPGGRVAAVGVGGLTLGGGLSYFSPQTGFVCDNVISYEIVLADGSIVNVSEDSDRDLWTALKGGSNNFGIVTSFDFISFELGDIFYGHYYYDLSTAPQQLDALHAFLNTPTYDEYATIIVSFGFSAGVGAASTNVLFYTQPEFEPPIFDNFTAIPDTFNTARVTNLTDATVEEGEPSVVELNQLYITTTIFDNRDLYSYGFDLWQKTRDAVSDIQNATLALTFQPLPPVVLNKSAGLGGNALNLDPTQNLVIILVVLAWGDPADTPFMRSQATNFIDQMNAQAASVGADSPYRYLNYADIDEKPFEGNGPGSLDELRAASKKYDPSGLFQEALPGGFKLFT